MDMNAIMQNSKISKNVSYQRCSKQEGRIIRSFMWLEIILEIIDKPSFNDKYLCNQYALHSKREVDRDVGPRRVFKFQELEFFSHVVVMLTARGH